MGELMAKPRGPSALRIKNLGVEIAGKRVLNGVNLEIPRGETHILFGPNGSGKTTLMMSILGFPSYRVVSGEILLNGTDITNMPTSERVKHGIGIAFQTPPAIRGVKLGDILHHLARGKIDEAKMTKAINFSTEFLNRDLNVGFSGGELRRSEILQLLVQRPNFAIFDEPDSGVDVENIEVVGRAINDLLKKRSGLLITHLGHILQYVEADKAHVMIKGRIACRGKPAKVLGQIMKKGYKWCEKCPKAKMPH